MKNFLKIVFATFLALMLFVLVVVLVGIGTVVGLVRLSSKQEPKIENGSYLVIDMSANITDSPPPSDNAQMLGKLLNQNGNETISLRSLLDSIHAAGKDNRIAGIYLHGSLAPEGYGSGYAAIKEVREALGDFRSSKKPVVAYLVSPSLRDYYLTSAADTVYLNPFGELELAGLAAEPMFLKGALDKYGVGVQVIRHGKYKSAVEPYLLDKMSPESREQTQKLLDDVWAEFKSGVSATRKGLTPDALQALADKDGLVSAEDAKQAGLVDGLAYLPDVIEILRQKSPGDTTQEKRTFRQVALASYIKQAVGKPEPAESALAAAVGNTGSRVAIVYAEGEIVDGEGDSNGSIGGDRFARELRKLRQDPSVKAILLRVNSPGGSGLASEVIQREMALARKDGKPVVVSMGTVAASGGYWISTASDRIFAEPNTITGSIGVFGVIPNFKGLANDHGVTFDEVKTGKLAGLFTVSRPKTDDEINVVQSLVEQFYQKFLGKVADSRKMDVAHVDEIAQGRVWSGVEALNLKLVDELGGLDTALAFTKSKAGLPADAKVVEYPAPREFAEQLADLFSNEKRPVAENHLLSRLGFGPRTGPLGRELGNVESDLKTLSRFNDPGTAYARMPFDLKMQ